MEPRASSNVVVYLTRTEVDQPYLVLVWLLLLYLFVPCPGACVSRIYPSEVSSKTMKKEEGSKMLGFGLIGIFNCCSMDGERDTFLSAGYRDRSRCLRRNVKNFGSKSRRIILTAPAYLCKRLSITTKRVP